ncbi:MAG: inorganic phosphate transporter, partial [Muribaculaceae bacterium]
TEDEKFGSTLFSRTLVRFAIAANAAYKKMIPDSLSNKIERRFELLPEDERGNVAYDNVRAVVNLAAAAILICIGTSFKLPLSTTYVVFMVAMGSSLADRAWGRDSAVYRITGVMVVISGWFMTAIAGFVLSFAIASSLIWGGWIALTAVVIVCGYALCHNLIFKSKKKDDEVSTIIEDSADAEDVLYSCTKSVCRLMDDLSAIYNHMLVALFTENRKVLKETVAQSEAIYRETTRYKYGMMGTLKKLQEQNVETGHYYVQVVDYLNETAKALLHITRPAYEHINNNHKGLSSEQIHDLKIINDEVENIFNAVNDMLREKDFSKLNDVLVMRDRLFDTIAECIKNQIRRLKTQEGSTKASALFMNILSETKVIVLQSRNLLKSEAYFLNKMSR